MLFHTLDNADSRFSEINLLFSKDVEVGHLTHNTGYVVMQP